MSNRDLIRSRKKGVSMISPCTDKDKGAPILGGHGAVFIFLFCTAWSASRAVEISAKRVYYLDLACSKERKKRDIPPNPCVEVPKARVGLQLGPRAGGLARASGARSTDCPGDTMRKKKRNPKARQEF